jgi:hypothetical protein
MRTRRKEKRKEKGKGQCGEGVHVATRKLLGDGVGVERALGTRPRRRSSH